MRFLNYGYKFIFSYLYLIVSSFYSFLFKINFLKTKTLKNLFIISVGNITAGGSGKTPFVILLSKLLSKHDIKHAVVSRGYKKKISGNSYLLPGKGAAKHSPASFGDEPFMLFEVLKNVPVFVGDKFRSLLKIQSLNQGRVALIDDGFQTHRLSKDLNILLLDCSLDISLYKILPLGLLREPIKNIEKADIVVLTKTNLTTSDNLSVLKKYFNNFINFKKQLVFNSEYHSSVLYRGIKGFEKINFNSFDFNDIQLISVCGIANPASFKNNLNSLNINVLKSFIFSNHYQYSSKNIKKIVSFCVNNKINSIITTKKDFYKLDPLFGGFSFYVVDVEHQICEHEQFVNFFKKKLVGDFK